MGRCGRVAVGEGRSCRFMAVGLLFGVWREFQTQPEAPVATPVTSPTTASLRIFKENVATCVYLFPRRHARVNERA